ncbi:MAG: type II secretion system F family protein [Candidatus Nanohaloarchaea archaeon]
MNLKTVYEQFPQRYREMVKTEANYAAMENYERRVVTGMLLTAVTVIAGTYLFVPWSWKLQIAIGVLGTIVATPAIPYLYVSLAAERRKSEMERILPDALNLISANMKSGHTIEKAFLLSARDEFGPLAEELRTTAMQMYGGTPVDEALVNMRKRVKSELFQETLKLLVDGIEAGGNTSELLQSSAEDIRSSLEIRDEIKSSIRMYMVFIVMAAVFGAPILFSISVYMANTTTTMWRQSGMGSGEQLSRGMSRVGGGFNLQFQAPQVNLHAFEQFAMMAILMTNIFSALIISEIQNGNIKEGAKYVPVFAAVSLALFIFVRQALATALGSF